MNLEDIIKKYESWKDHASDEIELAYVTLFLADLKNLKQTMAKNQKDAGPKWI